MDRRASRWRGKGVRAGPTLRVMGVLMRWLCLGGLVSELRGNLDWRGCPGTNRVGVVAVGKMIVLGMAISPEMEMCFFLLAILSTLVMLCIVDVGCLEDVLSK